MTYQEALDFLYEHLPMFQRIGPAAFKKDLSNTLALCAHLGQPQEQFKSVHIAGTNGKGSTAHALAAICRQAGLKTGLYTSPHLKSFTERIRINGRSMQEEAVARFVQTHQDYILELKPSFFEITVAMAFTHFAREQVDVAIIETGMGGRLDSTNVITPLLGHITNISYDHQQFLGDTLPLIAAEKAGIMKQGVPMTIGQTQPEVKAVFEKHAASLQVDLTFADQLYTIIPEESGMQSQRFSVLKDGELWASHWETDLAGSYQLLNLPGILACAERLQKLGFPLEPSHIKAGLASVQQLSGLRGRWQQLATQPFTLCDTGHNEAGWEQIAQQLSKWEGGTLHLVLGFVKDKTLDPVLKLLPQGAKYYFCQPDVPRAMPAEQAAAEVQRVTGMCGAIIPGVNDALQSARQSARPEDLIFVGGSTFVVAAIEEIN